MKWPPGHLQKDFPCDHWKLVAWRVSLASKRGMFEMMPTGGNLMVIWQKIRHILWYIILTAEYMMILCIWHIFDFTLYHLSDMIYYDEYVDVQFWLAQCMLCCVYYNLCSSWWEDKSSNHNPNSGKFREGKVVECTWKMIPGCRSVGLWHPFQMAYIHGV